MLLVPLRSPLLVARPRDWTASAAWMALAGLRTAFVVLALLVRVPPGWVALAGGYPLIVRGLFVLLSLWVIRWISDVAFARLPRASYLWGGAVTFPEQLGRNRVRLAEVETIRVQTQPAPVYEAFVMVMADGTTHVLCATHQTGAPQLYAAAMRRLSRAKRRAARRATRAATRATAAGAPRR